ncbi:unnamed protein product [Bursaphelenchus xylophilus]|uniref:Neurabin-1 n=1 Tax=Bursaphelenchus xylophilus TaxID=6326 RepID=A0A1I7SAH6_BURXY|nr:unnamed protein product [Bursaphelenchus xylophilus]CAG9079415.1 unnamed protein product [Bursaphelenchus xylophilus]
MSYISEAPPPPPKHLTERARSLQREPPSSIRMLDSPELCADDARARFSHTKAIFEQLEKHQRELPSFYSPRPVRHMMSSSVHAAIGESFATSFQSIPKCPPPVPPKPVEAFRHSAEEAPNSPTSSANTTTSSAASSPTAMHSNSAPSTPLKPEPSSPSSQVQKNFNQLADDLDRITKSPRTDVGAPTGLVKHVASKFQSETPPPPTFSNSLPRIGQPLAQPNKPNSLYKSTTLDNRRQKESPDSPPNYTPPSAASKQSQNNSYEPYWRDPSFYKRRFGVENEKGEEEHNSSESGDSVPSEPRPSQQSGSPNSPSAKNTFQFGALEQHRDQRPPANSFSLNQLSNTNSSDKMPAFSTLPRHQSTDSTLSGGFETLRGLSPDRDASGAKKVSFSTAPIKVFKTHGVDEYDRRNDEIDPYASSAEYELERRLDKMDMFEVEVEKGQEGLGFSIIGMGVGADFGLEKLGIFVKSITPGSALDRNGRIQVGDQIVSVDGTSLVGVSQLFAAQTLRGTGAHVKFVVARDPHLEESEVAALIKQSLESDRAKLAFKQRENDNIYSKVPSESPYGRVAESEDEDDVLNRRFRENSLPPALPPKLPDPASEIQRRIQALEVELQDSNKKASQMEEVLKSTRTHYNQLETKYDQARQMLRSYQERERKLIEVERDQEWKLREKDEHYGTMLGQMKERIEELEKKLEMNDKTRTDQVQTELNRLREQLATVVARDKKNNAVQTNDDTLTRHNVDRVAQEAPNKPPPLPPQNEKQTSERMEKKEKPQPKMRHEKEQFGHEQFDRPVPRGARHAGLTPRSIPLSAAPHVYERFMGGAYYLDEYGEERYMPPSSACDSPIPRISEPTSPAVPQKFLHHQRRMLFSLRKRYVHGENEFWRENVEAQGLQVLQWNIDEVCQLLIHMGLDKYIPEFSVNQITGPRFLDLDGSKLKTMGIQNHSDRAIIKKKIKTIKQRIERERKILEKESRQRTLKMTS